MKQSVKKLSNNFIFKQSVLALLIGNLVYFSLPIDKRRPDIFARNRLKKPQEITSQ